MRGQKIFESVGLVWYVIFKAIYWTLIALAASNAFGKLLLIQQALGSNP